MADRGRTTLLGQTRSTSFFLRITAAERGIRRAAHPRHVVRNLHSAPRLHPIPCLSLSVFLVSPVRQMMGGAIVKRSLNACAAVADVRYSARLQIFNPFASLPRRPTTSTGQPEHTYLLFLPCKMSLNSLTLMWKQGALGAVECLQSRARG